jgi:thioesterase domain-containing protein
VRSKELVRELTATPLRTWSKLEQAARRKLASRGALPELASETDSRDPELDVDGPLAQQMVRDYQRRVTRVEVPLLVVRARERDEPAWRRVDAHMGWLGLSPQLSIAPVPGSHLEILREPNVAITADAVRLLLSTPLWRGERKSAPSTRPSCLPMPLDVVAVSASRSRTGAAARARRR